MAGTEALNVGGTANEKPHERGILTNGERYTQLTLAHTAVVVHPTIT